MSSKNVLVFSIATNGYDEIFKEFLKSQSEFANKYGYDYKVFTGTPPGGISGSDSAWLKIPLILRALKEGYDWVMFLDSDCFVVENCPEIFSVEKRNKWIYMAYDGRVDKPNTGVIIVKNHKKVRRLLKKILWLSDLPNSLLPKFYIGLYEMGHLNYFMRNKDYLEIISKKWNDNLNVIKDHFILHAHGTFKKKKRSGISVLSKSKLLKNKVKEGLRVRRLIKQSNYFWSND